MSHDAVIWKGQEVEFESDKATVYVDGLSYNEIHILDQILAANEDVNEVYFAHTIDWKVIEQLLNKIRVTVEVPSVAEVPERFRGRVQTVLRTPRWVDKVKHRSPSETRVWSLDREQSETNSWHGQKTYSEDQVLYRQTEDWGGTE
jgi:hypothetical protein